MATSKYIYEGAEYSHNQLFEELKQKVKEERIESFAQFRELIDELVEDKRNFGFFTDEEDLQQIKADLELRWNDIKGDVGNVSKIMK